MTEINNQNISKIKNKGKTINCFFDQTNIDNNTVQSFGEEWKKFKHFSLIDINDNASAYFDIVKEEDYVNKIVLDAGCGSGRWSKYIVDYAKIIHLIDPSEAVFSAAEMLIDKKNVTISKTGINNIPFEDSFFDFIICLGVLHHIPDTERALKDCVKKLKPNGKILIYIYYNLDNRSFYYKVLFYISNLVRKIVCKLPTIVKKFVCDIIAISIYIPFKYIALFAKKNNLKKLFNILPLSFYHDKSFNIIRNDSLDRFGTPLEQRFSKKKNK